MSAIESPKTSDPIGALDVEDDSAFDPIISTDVCFCIVPVVCDVNVCVF
jgi:hypothetical protein